MKFFYLMLSLLINQYCHADVDYVDKIKAYVDFEEGKIWLHNEGKDKLLISTSGSILNLDSNIDSEDRVNLDPGFSKTKWLFFLDIDTPNVKDFIKIENYDKSRKIFDKKGYLKLSTFVFKINKDRVIEGPLIAPSIRCYPVDYTKLDNTTFGVHKIDLKKVENQKKTPDKKQ